MTRSKRARRLARRAYLEKHEGTTPKPVRTFTANTDGTATKKSSSKKTVKVQAQTPFFAKKEFTYVLYGAVALLVVILMVVWLRGRDDTANSSAQAVTTRREYSAPPPMTIDTNKSYVATIETDNGLIKLELFAKDAPLTVNSFVFLAREHFYDGTTFHRVIPGFMAQGGDPKGDGTGGPGYQFNNEISARKHLAGALSMANSGPNTNGSQFFITYTPQPSLDGSYNVFGQLTEGMDVLQKIRPRDPNTNPNFTGDLIKRITIEEK